MDLQRVGRVCPQAGVAGTKKRGRQNRWQLSYRQRLAIRYLEKSARKNNKSGYIIQRATTMQDRPSPRVDEIKVGFEVLLCF